MPLLLLSTERCRCRLQQSDHITLRFSHSLYRYVIYLLFISTQCLFESTCTATRRTMRLCRTVIGACKSGVPSIWNRRNRERERGENVIKFIQFNASTIHDANEICTINLWTQNKNKWKWIRDPLFTLTQQTCSPIEKRLTFKKRNSERFSKMLDVIYGKRIICAFATHRSGGAL